MHHGSKDQNREIRKKLIMIRIINENIFFSTNFDKILLKYLKLAKTFVKIWIIENWKRIMCSGNLQKGKKN